MKTVKYLGISLVVLSFLLLIAFFGTFSRGTDAIDSAAGVAIHVPLLTDVVLTWVYILFGVAIFVSIAVALSSFINSLITNPGKALKSLIPVILFLAVFVISFNSSSGERLSIIGYEGTQNEGVWVKIADMFLYTIYTMFVALLVSIFGSRIYSLFK